MDDRTRQMWMLYEAGYTLEEIGGLFHITRERVRQLFDKYDLPRRSNKGDGARTNVCTTCLGRYQRGHAAEHYQTAEHRAGIDPRRNMAKEMGIIKDYLDGVPLDEIGEKFSINAEEVYRYLHRNGVEPNRGGGSYIRTPEIRKKISERQKARWRARQT